MASLISASPVAKPAADRQPAPSQELVRVIRKKVLGEGARKGLPSHCTGYVNPYA